MSRSIRLSGTVLVLAGLFLFAGARGAFASSGSITNVRAVGGQVQATYSTSFDVCTGTYCGWYAHAYQYPASQPCAPNGSHLTYVGEFHSTSGSETATDDFYPAYTGSIRICLYGYHSGANYFIAQALFVPQASMSGSITNVHLIGGRRVSATYTTKFNVCTLGSCAWFPHAWQLPASQACRVDKSRLTYVGDFHQSAGTERSTASFYPRGDAVRICLYVSHHQKEYLIADTVYFRTPAPTQAARMTVGDQSVSFYYPRGCVAAGRPVQLSVTSRTIRSLVGHRPKTSIARVQFSLDQPKRIDTRAPWQATFSTLGFVPRSRHQVSVKITFNQRNRRQVVRTVSRTFRIC